MTLANQAMRAACAREPRTNDSSGLRAVTRRGLRARTAHYVEKGIEAFRCSKIK